uniref:Uncharacterized protein n=1 Tax=Rhizophora mucronata TaxID=61149 RepID=A0A2P2PA48_RHIMU
MKLKCLIHIDYKSIASLLLSIDQFQYSLYPQEISCLPC